MNHGQVLTVEGINVEVLDDEETSPLVKVLTSLSEATREFGEGEGLRRNGVETEAFGC